MKKKHIESVVADILAKADLSIVQSQTLIIRDGKLQSTGCTPVRASDKIVGKLTKKMLTKGLTSKEWSSVRMVVAHLIDEGVVL